MYCTVPCPNEALFIGKFKMMAFDSIVEMSGKSACRSIVTKIPYVAITYLCQNRTGMEVRYQLPVLTVFICLVMCQLAGKAVETKALDLEGQIQAIDSHQATALKSVIILFISHIKGPLSFWIRIGFSADPNLDQYAGSGFSYRSKSRVLMTRN